MIPTSLPSPDRRTPALFTQLSRLARQVSSHPSVEQVHHLRTTVRRVETLLEATGMGRGTGAGKLLKQLRRLRRRAGRVRDVDVQLAALREIKQEASGAEKAAVMRHLQKVRRKRERKLVVAAREELADGVQERLKTTLKELLTRAAGATPSKDFTATALEQFAKLARTSPALTHENLHGFRMACKRIRYLAEMSGANGGTRQVVSQFKRIQDAIGEWHDWLTLTESAESVVATPHSPLLTALRTRRSSKFIHALRVAAECKAALLQIRKDRRREAAKLAREETATTEPAPQPEPSAEPADDTSAAATTTAT